MRCAPDAAAALPAAAKSRRRPLSCSLSPVLELAHCPSLCCSRASCAHRLCRASLSPLMRAAARVRASDSAAAAAAAAAEALPGRLLPLPGLPLPAPELLPAAPLPALPPCPAAAGSAPPREDLPEGGRPLALRGDSSLPLALLPFLGEEEPAFLPPAPAAPAAPPPPAPSSCREASPVSSSSCSSLWMSSCSSATAASSSAEPLGSSLQRAGLPAAAACSF